MFRVKILLQTSLNQHLQFLTHFICISDIANCEWCWTVILFTKGEDFMSISIPSTLHYCREGWSFLIHLSASLRSTPPYQWDFKYFGSLHIISMNGFEHARLMAVVLNTGTAEISAPYTKLFQLRWWFPVKNMDVLFWLHSIHILSCLLSH